MPLTLSNTTGQGSISFINNTGQGQIVFETTVTSSIGPIVSATPSITPSLTPSITPSITVTPTPSITVTPSISITPSVTPTVTPSITTTPSVTPSISITPSITPSPGGSPATGSVYTQLDTIIPVLRANTGSLRNPNFFVYFLDGNSYFISDGGNDMYDGGNYTAPWVRNNTSYLNSATIPITVGLNYTSQSATLTDTSFYYASIGYSQSTGSFPGGTQNPRFHPLTIIGARSGSGPIGFQKAGNIGADGGGSLVATSIYSGSVVNGFTTYAYYRQTFGQSADPAVCDVYVLLGHPNWGSVFDTVVSSSINNTDSNGGTLYATGSSSEILAMTTLLSRTGSIAVTFNEVKTVVDNYVSLVKTALNY
jgi:hypothetical protein